jgi:hypothetical protein
VAGFCERGNKTCKSVLLDFVHRLNKIQLFGSQILFPSLGEKSRCEDRSTKGPQQIGFLSSSLFYLKTEAESSFRNVVVS